MNNRSPNEREKNRNPNNNITITYSFVCKPIIFVIEIVLDGSKIQNEHKTTFIVLVPLSGAHEAEIAIQRKKKKRLAARKTSLDCSTSR